MVQLDARIVRGVADDERVLVPERQHVGGVDVIDEGLPEASWVQCLPQTRQPVQVQVGEQTRIDDKVLDGRGQ